MQEVYWREEGNMIAWKWYFANRRFVLGRPTVPIAVNSIFLSVALLLTSSLGLAQDKQQTDKQRPQSSEAPTGKAVIQEKQPPAASKAASIAKGQDQVGKPGAQVQTTSQAKSEDSNNEPLKPLHPERIKYSFYSLYFTVIPVSVLVLFLILLLHFGRPDSQANFESYFGGGQTTQLVVILVIAGNVCSLAIAGIIGGSEVAAIYGGIVGYVLGKDRDKGPAQRPGHAQSSGT